ncbi:MAG TPA: SCP2 sterol-binding domain-containing protein [Solirubrobacterales bacterium]|nr:SCP2 sterol-binding domain-containing protein [Solirubrobacterales bacterium]
MSEAPTSDSLNEFDAGQLAQLVAGASDEQLAQGMSEPAGRKATLDEIFRRMAEHVEPAKARGNDAVIHWMILDHPDGGHDHYEVILAEGACVVSDEPSREPRVAFKIGPVDFLRLVSGNAAGPMLFMTGKLKIEGDLMFASTMTSLFRIPRGEATAPAAGDQAAANAPAAGDHAAATAPAAGDQA